MNDRSLNLTSCRNSILDFDASRFRNRWSICAERAIPDFVRFQITPSEFRPCHLEVGRSPRTLPASEHPEHEQSGRGYDDRAAQDPHLRGIQHRR